MMSKAMHIISNIIITNIRDNINIFISNRYHFD